MERKRMRVGASVMVTLAAMVGLAVTAAVLFAACEQGFPQGGGGDEGNVRIPLPKNNRSMTSQQAKDNTDFYQVYFHLHSDGSYLGAGNFKTASASSGDGYLSLSVPEGFYDILLISGHKDTRTLTGSAYLDNYEVTTAARQIINMTITPMALSMTWTYTSGAASLTTGPAAAADGVSELPIDANTAIGVTLTSTAAFAPLNTADSASSDAYTSLVSNALKLTGINPASPPYFAPIAASISTPANNDATKTTGATVYSVTAPPPVGSGTAYDNMYASLYLEMKYVPFGITESAANTAGIGSAWFIRNGIGRNYFEADSFQNGSRYRVKIGAPAGPVPGIDIPLP